MQEYACTHVHAQDNCSIGAEHLELMSCLQVDVPYNPACAVCTLSGYKCILCCMCILANPLQGVASVLVHLRVLLTANHHVCWMVGLSVWHSSVNMYSKASKVDFCLRL